MFSLRYLSLNNIIRCNLLYSRGFNSLKKVYPTSSTENKTQNIIDNDTIELLEKLSLVDCVNKEDIKTLETAIDFADQIFEVDTKDVGPLITVLEDYPLRVREDEVTEGNCREDIIKNASVIEEDYFVAPPGNIPLQEEDFSSKTSDKSTKIANQNKK